LILIASLLLTLTLCLSGFIGSGNWRLSCVVRRSFILIDYKILKLLLAHILLRTLLPGVVEQTMGKRLDGEAGLAGDLPLGKRRVFEM
jgi:hypothetical protein